MRVLHLCAGNLYGGIEVMLTTLARHRDLCPDMRPDFVLCFDGRLSEELKASGVGLHWLGAVRISRPWTVWLARRRLGRVLGDLRPDVVVSHGCWPHAVFAPVVRAARLPLVYWAHDANSGRHWLERWAARTPPDLVLANSKLTQASLPCLFPDVPSEVVYLPVPQPPALDRAANRKEVRAALMTAEDAVVVIQACRLERWKGHALLLEALGLLAGLPGWVCWIAGGVQRPHEHEYLGELQRQAARLGIDGRVRFLGQRSDVSRLLAAADIHCQPNTGPEPFGIAFVEAMYAGLPVVTTEMGGALEIIDHNCGVLVRPGSSEQLAEVLAKLVQSKEMRSSLGERAPERAQQLCAPIVQMTRLRELLSIPEK
jgi:glycosyltransferase involved in cell wall biosynthesis